jgi:ferredoxin-NADP reductase
MFCAINAAGKQLVHPFSISSSPTESYLEFTKKFTPNEYSVALRSLKSGDTATIDAPYGTFTFEGEYPKIALLTGGIGITPFRSIIKYSTNKQLPCQIALFYGCRTPKDIAFKDDLMAMQAKYGNLKLVFVVNEPDGDWTGPVGNITLDLVKNEIPDYRERVFFACGPPGMVTAMTSMVKQLGLPSTSLKPESFAGYT